MFFMIIIVILLAASFYILSQIGNVASTPGKQTPAQIAQYAYQAGWTGYDALLAVAVAIAESGGDPQAYNPETAAGAPINKGSYGLWQIYLNAHPEFEGENLFDPQTNANAAFSIWQNSGGWNPWSTYKSGAYQANLFAAQKAVQAVGA